MDAPDAVPERPGEDKAMTAGESDDTATHAPRSAFDVLMAPPQPRAPPSPSWSSSAPSWDGRMALGAFLRDPTGASASTAAMDSGIPPSLSSSPSSPLSAPSAVIYHNDHFVAVRDKFPKATVHTLLLPRSTAHCLLHPFDALQDEPFLAAVRAEAGALRRFVASELRRRLGSYSRAEARRQAVLDDVDDDGAPAVSLPPGRDWEAELLCGVHAVPSMKHLHIHVLSRDMHSPKLRHRKHYNSFNTPFLVGLDEFPLRDDDPRRDTRSHPYLSDDLRCWRCGRNFGRQFQRLKEHLEHEFDQWRRL